VAQEERKVVTLLFLDLAGFAARAAARDPEDVRSTLVRYHAEVRTAVEHFGGVVDKTIGDEVVAVFGAPIGHEDDPERAVRAALDVAAAVRALGERDPDLGLTPRVGINTGEAIVSFGVGPQVGESVTGDAVNTAARLREVAEPGQIVVGEATYEASRDRIVYEELPPAVVKGKAEPLEVWMPVAPRSRPPVEVRPRPSTPFVGRAEELTLLRSAFRRTIAEPSVQLVTIVGEPGSGKSRLIDELFGYIDELPDLVRWREGRSLPYGEGVGFWPLTQMVKAEAGILESDAPEEVGAKLDRSVSILIEEERDRVWIRARLAHLVGLGEEAADRADAFAAWRTFFEAMAATNPTVLVFEDLHWADQSLLEFVDQLVEWAAGLPVLVLCAARPELFDRHPGWGGGKRNSTILSLPPLTEGETASLLAALLEGSALGVETQASLLERAGGNPLFAESFARMLVEREDGARGGDVAEGDDDGSEFPVPQSVQAIIGARLDTLDPEDKVLLHDAAVMGRVFWSGAVAAMSGVDEATVKERLRRIARKELVRPARGSTVKDQDEYSFWHTLIRDVAYGQIPRAARGAKHLAAARWIEGLASERVTDRAEVLAHHYGEALELARSAGEREPRAGLAERAARYAEMAGDRIRGLDAAAAEAWFERALRWLPPDESARDRVLLKAADAHLMVGKFDEAERTFREAAEASARRSDTLLHAEATASLARTVLKARGFAEAEPLLAEASALLETCAPSRECVRARSRLTGIYLIVGRYRELLERSEVDLAMARDFGVEEEEVRSLQFRGAARTELGDPAGLDDLREAYAKGLELGLGEETAVACGNLAFETWVWVGAAAALELWTRNVVFCEARGLLPMATTSRSGQLETLFDLGRWDEVLRVADEIQRRGRGYRGSGEPEDESPQDLQADVYRAWVLGRRGRTAEAIAAAEGNLPRARRAGYPEVLAQALLVAAMTERLRGDEEAWRRDIEEFARETEEHVDSRVLYLPLAVRAMVAGGEVDLAASMLVPDEAVTAPRHRSPLLSARAAVAEARGRHAEAAEWYEEAAARWAELECPMEEGLALAGLGRCHLALGRTDEARAPLGEARARLAALRADPDVEDVDRALAAVEAGARSVADRR
jgi:class 3 adenylate cyclase/tetratricopeptide (TPR) repeat protein